MRRTACSLTVVALLGLGCEPPVPTPQAKPLALDLGDASNELLGAHNAQRAAQGLPPLRLDPAVQQAAQAHAHAMAASGRMAHVGVGDGSPWSRLEEAGYDYSDAAENVAAWQPDVASVMSAWMNSPGHRINILGPYRDCGMALAYSNDGRAYWCALFATSKTASSP